MRKIVESKEIEVCQHIATKNANGFKVCIDCGLVLDRVYVKSNTILLEPSIVSHVFDTKQWIERFSKYFGTYIGKKKVPLRDHANKNLAPYNNELFRRLIRMQVYTMKDLQKSKDLRAIQVLNILSKTLHIKTFIKNNTVKLYHHICKENRIKNRIALIAYCFFYELKKARQYGWITLNEVVRVFTDNNHRLTKRMLFNIQKEFHEYFPNLTPRRSEDFLILTIDKINKKDIEFSPTERLILEKKCMEILNKIPLAIRSNSPLTILAAVIYRAGKEINLKLTQEIISKSCNITSVSLRNNYNKYIKNRV